MGLVGFLQTKIRNYRFRKSGLTFGKGTIIMNRLVDYGSEPYLIRIGDHCSISTGVRFITHDGGTRVFRDNPEFAKGRRQVDINKYGTIELKDNVYIGMDTIIMPNVTIGPNSVVGAGCVIRRNVPPNVVVAGNPARVVCTLEEYIKICDEETIQFPEHYSSKREFLEKYFWGK